MGKKKLLVEGKDDGIVIGTLCKSQGFWAQHKDYADREKPREIPFLFECKNKQSIEQLLDELDVEIQEADLEVMGIVVDADSDLASRWASLSNRLQKCGYSVLPDVPDAAGTIIEEADLPKLGVWVMPDNQLGGMLEDFIALLIPDGDALWPYAQKCVAEIDEAQRPFTRHVAKANIHTWLAWQETPGRPLGSAINEHYLKADAPHSLIFIEWIKRLFNA